MDGYWPVIGIALGVAIALPTTITLVMIKLSKPKLGKTAQCNTQMERTFFTVARENALRSPALNLIRSDTSFFLEFDASMEFKPKFKLTRPLAEMLGSILSSLTEGKTSINWKESKFTWVWLSINSKQNGLSSCTLILQMFILPGATHFTIETKKLVALGNKVLDVSTEIT